jgi:hypothetical protein
VEQTLLIAWLLQAAVCACFSAFVAGQKCRSAGAWFLLGLLFGIFALIAVSGLPVSSEPKGNGGGTPSASSSGGETLWDRRRRKEEERIRQWEQGGGRG